MAQTGEVSDAELDAMDGEVMSLIERAVTEARAAPRPSADQVEQDVYINYGT